MQWWYKVCICTHLVDSCHGNVVYMALVILNKTKVIAFVSNHYRLTKLYMAIKLIITLTTPILIWWYFAWL